MDQRRKGPLPHLLAQNPQRIALRIAGMDNQRQAGGARHMDMRAKQGLLRGAVGMVVIIIEAGLADGHHPGVRRSLQQNPLAHIGVFIGLMRVDADAGPDIRLLFGKGDDIGPFALAGGDVQEAADACRARARQHGLLLFDQPLVIEVAMGIDEHRPQPSPSVGISRRGKMPTGWPRRKPEARRRSYHVVSDRATKLRSSAGMPIWSSSLAAEVGMMGWMAMARLRKA